MRFSSKVSNGWARSKETQAHKANVCRLYWTFQQDYPGPPALNEVSLIGFSPSRVAWRHAREKKGLRDTPVACHQQGYQ